MQIIGDYVILGKDRMQDPGGHDMNQPIYTTLKVHNEIELCEISDPECKRLIEQALLKERISFFIRWLKPSLFHRKTPGCVFCINESAMDAAEDIVRSICDEGGYPVKFLLKRTRNEFL